MWRATRSGQFTFRNEGLGLFDGRLRGPQGGWIFWKREKYPLTGIEIIRSSNCRLLHLLQRPTVPTVGSEGVAVAQSI
jgi:hypothetical protein